MNKKSVPLKLYYITNARIPTEKAHGQQIIRMCREYAHLGFDVHLIVPTRCNPITQDLFTYYDIPREFEITYLPTIDALDRSMILKRFLFWVQTLSFFLSVQRMIITDGIIYTRNPGIVWMMKWRRLKTVYECHNWFGRSVWLALRFLRKCDCIVTTNTHIKRKFLENGFENSRLLVAPNSVDLEIFALDGMDKNEALEKIALDDSIKEVIYNSKVIMYTGNFHVMGYEKGIEYTMRAVKQLDRKDVIFIAIGGSQRDREYYNQRARKLKVSDRVYLLARRSQQELSLFQKMASVLIMPIPDRANFRYFISPLKTFEYMASTRPIIATTLPSITEILNENNSFLISPDNVSELTWSIEYVLSHPEESKEKANCARSAVAQYTWKNRAQKIIERIEQLV